MKNLLNAEETLDLVELKSAGYGSRYIAKLLGISKSSVNNYYKLWLKSQTPIKDSLQVEYEKAVNRGLYGTDYKPEDVALGKAIDSAVDEFGKPRLASTLVGMWKRKEKTEVKKPRVLFIDLESRPDTVVTFRRFKATIGSDNVLREGGGLLSVACAFDDEQVQGFALTPEQAIADDDSTLVATLWDAIEQCDFVVAHNLDKFDMALFKARCVVNGFPPPKRVKQIDTLKQAKQMKFQSNRLDALGQSLGEGSKLSHSGIRLWIDCMEGKQEALNEMLAYNIQDVELLRNVYHRLKAFDVKHPNAGIYSEDNQHICRVCSSSDLSKTNNSIQAGLSLFDEYVCNACGARSRVRNSSTTKDKRNSLLV